MEQEGAWAPVGERTNLACDWPLALPQIGQLSRDIIFLKYSFMHQTIICIFIPPFNTLVHEDFVLYITPLLVIITFL